MNNAYINIVEHTSGNKPISVRDYSNIDFSSAIDLLINKCKSHPSIIEKNASKFKISLHFAKSRSKM